VVIARRAAQRWHGHVDAIEDPPDNRVEVTLGDDALDADHLITADERLRIAIARQ
jgi:hypothetical protein